MVPNDEKDLTEAAERRQVKRFTSTKIIKNAKAADWRKRFRGRSIKFGDKEKQIFLNNYKLNGLMLISAETAGVHACTVRNHLDSDEEFAEAFDEAREAYRDRVVEHHQDLVFNGVRNPILGGKEKDKVVGEKIDYPIRLIEMELKRVEPAYRDKHEVSHDIPGGVLVVNGTTYDLDKYREELEKHRLKTIEDQKNFAKTIEGEIVQ